MKCLLDTHPLVFYLLNPEKLGPETKQLLVNQELALTIPSIVILELQYLIEIGRVNAEILEVMRYINREPHLEIKEFGMTELPETLALTSTRDPFDRIILATAITHEMPLITRDRWMQEKYTQTIW
jgi:PIN domain nuclease of toxin-antitoxin system